MEAHGKFTLMSIQELPRWLSSENAQRAVKLVQNHHTYDPSYAQFHSDNHFALLEGMERYQVQERGFACIAQHFTTFPDGTIATGRPLNQIPAGIKGANLYGICIENMGNFDRDKDVMTAEQRVAIIQLNASLCHRFAIQPGVETIVYHHWYDLTTGARTEGTGDTKSCPGTAFFGGNTVDDARRNLIPEVEEALESFGNPEPTQQAGADMGTVNADHLNVRSGPGSSFPIVATLSKGTPVVIQDERKGWYKVGLGKEWVFCKYVTPVSSTSPVGPF
jgi:hypothetical protein